MSYGDIIGYVCDGDIYCENCAQGDDLSRPVFSYEESDSPQHCGECHAFLGGRLTRDGWKDLVERIQKFEHEFWPELLCEYVQHWNMFDWYVIPTFIGYMDPFGDYKQR